MKKSTIYIDIEDDIASIIEKISSAEQKIVALVLPKRPNVLQSSVNVQLLKRSSDEASKNIVLITNDDQVMRLAGQSGIYVSSSLQSKPIVPIIALSNDTEVDEISDNGASSDDIDPAQPDVYVGDEKIDLKTPVGDLVDGKEEDIELDNTEDIDKDAVAVALTAKNKKTKEKKKFSVPNFSKFKTRLVIGGLAVILIVAGLFWAFVIAPKATIVLTTEKSDIQVKIPLTASTTQATVDVEKGLVPAIKKEDKQKLTGTFTATGQKDVGDKATGTVTFKNCEDSSPVTIPSGTGVSKGSYTFITQAAVTLPGGTFSGGGTNCTSSWSDDIKVVASQPGDQFNVAAGAYTVAGNFGNIKAQGSAMGGGTTKTVKVVTDQDVETAKQKALEKAADNVKGKIVKLLTDEGLVPIEETFVTQQADAVLTVKVGEETTADVTITVELTSTMLGIKSTDVDPFITKEVADQVDLSKQKIYDNGASKAVVTVTERPNNDSVKINFASSVAIGPLLDPQVVASEIAGKKAGEAKQLLEAKPGVTRADITLKPFWVFSIPKNTSKIAITVNE